MRIQWIQIIFIALAVGGPALRWLMNELQTQAARKRADEARRRQALESLRTGRPIEDPSSAASATADLRVTAEAARRRQLEELALRRQAQLEELRRRQREAAARATTPPVPTAPRPVPRPSGALPPIATSQPRPPQPFTPQPFPPEPPPFREPPTLQQPPLQPRRAAPPGTGLPTRPPVVRPPAAKPTGAKPNARRLGSSQDLGTAPTPLRPGARRDARADLPRPADAFGVQRAAAEEAKVAASSSRAPLEASSLGASRQVDAGVIAAIKGRLHDRENLRAAIVLAEIFAPPLALRSSPATSPASNPAAGPDASAPSLAALPSPPRPN